MVKRGELSAANLLELGKNQRLAMQSACTLLEHSCMHFPGNYVFVWIHESCCHDFLNSSLFVCRRWLRRRGHGALRHCITLSNSILQMLGEDTILPLWKALHLSFPFRWYANLTVKTNIFAIKKMLILTYKIPHDFLFYNRIIIEVLELNISQFHISLDREFSFKVDYIMLFLFSGA